MLTKFFFMLKKGGMKPSITELLTLLEALKSGLAGHSVDDFYYLSRAALVKDETQFDRFDRIFAAHFAGIEDAFQTLAGEVPDDWLRKQAELLLTEEERAQIEGVRIGQQGCRHRRAVKVWDRREYRNLDDNIELGTRNIKIALRKLRKFAREGAADQLDLDDTIDKTARNAGLLDIRMVPERHNAVKVLLCLDIGGSMDDHVRICEEMFSAARSEFKHLEYFYFHNFIYESMWKDNRRRHGERIPTHEITHKYGADYKLVFVGDATMSPYEIVYAGGSVEHWNDEPGAVWIKRLLYTYPKASWLNAVRQQRWGDTASIKLTRELMDDRMYPLTIRGLDDGIKRLH